MLIAEEYSAIASQVACVKSGRTGEKLLVISFASLSHITSPLCSFFSLPYIMSTTEIGYLTDVEGNYDYYQSYIARSTVLAYTDEEKTTLQLKPNTIFVFGGMAKYLSLTITKKCYSFTTEERNILRRTSPTFENSNILYSAK